MNITPYDISVWVLPLVIAITFHEAAHGFVAHRLGDNTAYDLAHSYITERLPSETISHLEAKRQARDKQALIEYLKTF